MLGIAAGSSLSQAHDKEESPLGKIMEKVNKHNSMITKGVRNKVNFAKSQKDVEKSAKELVKLAKEAKPIKDAAKKAKDVAEPPEEMGRIHRRLDQDLRKARRVVSAKPSATVPDAKNAFDEVKKACADCHKDFRVDDAELLTVGSAGESPKCPAACFRGQ